MTSTIDTNIPPLRPSFSPSTSTPEPAAPQTIISALKFQPHVEGGYFVETDRDIRRVANPFVSTSDGSSPTTRSASTTIFYLLTPSSPQGNFHRNRGRTVHTLHKGRGRYVIIHADEVASAKFPGGYGTNGERQDAVDDSQLWQGKARIETFIVGQDIARGEKLQWIVEGGKYKASFLLPDEAAGSESHEGLLISETVVPGFEFEDHDFMREERLAALVTESQREELKWLIRKE